MIGSRGTQCLIFKVTAKNIWRFLSSFCKTFTVCLSVKLGQIGSSSPKVWETSWRSQISWEWMGRKSQWVMLCSALLYSPSTTATERLLTSNVSSGAALQPGVKHCDCVGQLPGVNVWNCTNEKQRVAIEGAAMFCVGYSPWMHTDELKGHRLYASWIFATTVNQLKRWKLENIINMSELVHWGISIYLFLSCLSLDTWTHLKAKLVVSDFSVKVYSSTIVDKTMWSQGPFSICHTIFSQST